MKIKSRLCSVLLCLSMALLTGCDGKASVEQVAKAADPPSAPVIEDVSTKEEKVTYDLDLIFDDRTLTLTGREEIRIKNRALGDSILLHLWMNAYKDGKKGKFFFPEMKERIFSKGDSKGSIEIAGVWINGEAAPFRIEEELLWIDYTKKAYQEDMLRITLDFSIQIPQISHRNGANDQAIWLGNWIPTLAVQDGDKWIVSSYLPAGDPFYTQVADYNLRIQTPPTYQVVGTGEETVENEGTNKITYIRSSKVRDIALAMSKDYKRYQHTTQNGLELNLYSYSLGEKTANSYLKELEKIMDYYSSRIGPYPYKSFDVVETEFMTGGMEYPGLIMVSSQNLRDFSKGSATILHETGHQWFYGILGNNQLQDAWFDEGLTTFIQKGYEMNAKGLEDFYQKEKVQLKKALEPWKNIALGQELEIYQSWSHYYRVNYRRAALMHYEISQVMGSEAYDQFLKELYNQYQYKIVTKENFRNLCERFGGEKAVGVFNSYF
ncbi:MAG: M1 family metallopeptidase [Thermotaleaceae bacterium]